MTTAYIYAANVVCLESHIAIGNALASAIDPDIGGNQTFTKGLKCYPAGTTFSGTGPMRTANNPVAARASFPLLTARGYDLVSEFNTDGPWPNLNALGFTDEQVAAAKGALTLEVGPRNEIEDNGVSFVKSLGYVV